MFETNCATKFDGKTVVCCYTSFGITASSICHLSNCQQYETLVTIVTMLKECSRKVTFDLATRAEYRDPERMERTVYVSPLAANITPDMVKVSLKIDVKVSHH